jgi:hypothetical protein
MLVDLKIVDLSLLDLVLLDCKLVELLDLEVEVVVEGDFHKHIEEQLLVQKM